MPPGLPLGQGSIPSHHLYRDTSLYISTLWRSGSDARFGRRYRRKPHQAGWRQHAAKRRGSMTHRAPRRARHRRWRALSIISGTAGALAIGRRMSGRAGGVGSDMRRPADAASEPGAYQLKHRSNALNASIASRQQQTTPCNSIKNRAWRAPWRSGIDGSLVYLAAWQIMAASQ